MAVHPTPPPAAGGDPNPSRPGGDAPAPHEAMMPGETPGAERWKLLVAWMVVGVPAAWGVWQVVLKSLALFR